MQTPNSPAASTESAPPPSRPMLLDEIRRRLRVKRYSLRTEQAYLYWIRRYIRANGMHHPRELSGAAVERFLSDLALKGRVAPSTQNQALAAVLFLYREVLALDLPWMENIVRAKRVPRLPVVLSRADTLAVLRAMSGREVLMAGLLYGSGLRLMECLRLRVKDIDFMRNEIDVREGKGARIARRCCPRRCGSRCKRRSHWCGWRMRATWRPDSVRCRCPLRSPASTGTPSVSSDGSTCFPQHDVASIRSTEGRSIITSTKACSSVRCAARRAW